MADATNLGEQVALMLEGLALSEETMRCSIIWAGTEYPCVGGPEFGGKRLDQGGFRLHAKCKIKIRNEVFSEGSGLPAEKQLIQYKRNASAEPRTFRIAAITQYYGAFMEFELEDPNEGA